MTTSSELPVLSYDRTVNNNQIEGVNFCLDGGCGCCADAPDDESAGWAAEIVKRCNAYPRLLNMLRRATTTADLNVDANVLLKELGEV